MKKNYPLVSGIVTNYNGWQLGLLKDFFESFLKSDYENFEIFLVDMASSDDSVTRVKEHFGRDKRLKIVINPINNMSAGIDTALKKAKGKYILFLNNDVYFPKGSIKKLVDFLDENKQVAQVQGKIVSYFNHRKIDSVGETMDIYGNPLTLGAGETDHGQYNKIQEVLSVAGAAAMLRQDLLTKVGLLDSDYGIGYEDMDLSLRLRLAGYKMFYLPDVVVYHKRASSTSRASDELKAKIKFWFNKNRLSTIIKNYEVPTLIRSLPFVLVIYVATGLFEIFYKRLWKFGLSRFLAIGWTMTNFLKLVSKRRKVQSIRKLRDKEAFLPYMSKGRIFESFRGFLQNKNW